MSVATSTYLIPSSLLLLRQVWQGRATRLPSGSFQVDGKDASDSKDLQLRWLHDNGYIDSPALVIGDEWAVVRTAEFGDEVLAANRADEHQFREMSAREAWELSEAHPG